MWWNNADCNEEKLEMERESSAQDESLHADSKSEEGAGGHTVLSLPATNVPSGCNAAELRKNPVANALAIASSS